MRAIYLFGRTQGERRRKSYEGKGSDSEEHKRRRKGSQLTTAPDVYSLSRPDAQGGDRWAFERPEIRARIPPVERGGSLRFWESPVGIGDTSRITEEKSTNDLENRHSFLV